MLELSNQVQATHQQGRSQRINQIHNPTAFSISSQASGANLWDPVTALQLQLRH
jgi:hypothetical protein